MSNVFSALKRGAVVLHKEGNRTGVVIDWGIVVDMKTEFNGRSRKFMIPNNDLADSVRVRTEEGAIEIWPAEIIAYQ